MKNGIHPKYELAEITCLRKCHKDKDHSQEHARRNLFCLPPVLYWNPEACRYHWKSGEIQQALCSTDREERQLTIRPFRKEPSERMALILYTEQS